jgi:hypothetical protein
MTAKKGFRANRGTFQPQLSMANEACSFADAPATLLAPRKHPTVDTQPEPKPEHIPPMTTRKLILILILSVAVSVTIPHSTAANAAQAPDGMVDPKIRTIELQKKLIAELKTENARLLKENASLKSEIEKSKKDKQP